MKIVFYKYQGTGNDFILVNNLKGNSDLNENQIQLLCDRHFGIGSDGLILVENSVEADYKMNFYNPDGSQSLCGNGARCTFQFVSDLNLVPNAKTFEAIDGLHEVKIESGMIAVKMHPVEKYEVTDKYYFINTGSPHYIEYRDDIDDLDVKAEGRRIRYSERFSDSGTNVNFVEQKSTSQVKMRTYERGVEDETLSCGTGVTAVALSMFLRNPKSEKIHIETNGGQLEVEAEYRENTFRNIWLKGPAKFVYKGEIEL